MKLTKTQRRAGSDLIPLSPLLRRGNAAPKQRTSHGDHPMTRTRTRLTALAAIFALAFVVPGAVTAGGGKDKPSAYQIPAGGPVKKIEHSDAEWRKLLTPEQYRVLRQQATDIAFTGKYVHVKGSGV